MKDNILIRARKVLEKDDVKSREDILMLADAAAEKIFQKG